MTDVLDPGPEAADRILADLEECKWSPAEVARQARRLRAHIEALRDPSFDALCAAVADSPLACEAEGTAADQLGDEIVRLARKRRAPVGGFGAG